MGRCRGAIKIMAKDAIGRMASGFWEREYDARAQRLSVVEQTGKDKTEAIKFFVAETKAQLKRENVTGDELYLKARRMFLSGAEGNALSVLIDKSKFGDLNDTERQRYIFDLSQKLQEYRKRFNAEQEYGLQANAI